MKKLVRENFIIFLFTKYQRIKKFGRGGGIRTRDPLHPMQVRYQAALRPDGDFAKDSQNSKDSKNQMQSII